MTWSAVWPAVVAILALRGDAPPVHQLAARAAASPDVPERLLLAVAWVESRYYPDSVSRIEDGRRRTGRWSSTRPVGSGPRFCGPLQARAGRSWSRCLALRDVWTGYRVGASELRYWVRVCAKWRRAGRRDPGVVRCALAGHGGGNRAARRGDSRYARAVLRRLQRSQ